METLEQRLDEIEMAVMLFLAILTGEPADATEEQKEAAQIRLGQIMRNIQKRHL